MPVRLSSGAAPAVERTVGHPNIYGRSVVRVSFVMRWGQNHGAGGVSGRALGKLVAMPTWLVVA